MQCAVYKEENIKCYTFVDREPVKRVKDLRNMHYITCITCDILH